MSNDGSPPSTQNDVGSSAENASRRPPRSLLSRVVILLTFAIVFGPIIVQGLPEEPLKWQLASAQEHYLEGDYKAALDGLERLMEKQAASVHLKLQWTDWTLEYVKQQIQQGSVDDADVKSKLMEVDAVCIQLWEARDSYSGKAKIAYVERVLANQSNAHCLMGDFSKGAKILATLAELEKLPSVGTINNNCYHNALANQNLRSSLAQMNVLIKKIKHTSDLAHMSALLTARNKKYEEALTLVDWGILIENAHREVRTEKEFSFEQHITAIMERGTTSKEHQNLLKKARLLREQNNIRLAQLHTYRGKLHRKLEREELKAEDWNRVEELGFNPEELSGKTLPTEHCLDKISHASAWYDTRGFIRYKMKDYVNARLDMDLAVRFARAQVNGIEFQTKLQSRALVDIRTLEKLRASYDGMLATLLYHRSMVHDHLGNQDLKAKDLAEVNELGFRPGKHLF